MKRLLRPPILLALIAGSLFVPEDRLRAGDRVFVTRGIKGAKKDSEGVVMYYMFTPLTRSEICEVLFDGHAKSMMIDRDRLEKIELET